MRPERISFFTGSPGNCNGERYVCWTFWFDFSEIQVMKMVIYPILIKKRLLKYIYRYITWNVNLSCVIEKNVGIDELSAYLDGTRDIITKRRCAVNTSILFSVLSPPFSSLTGTFRIILACFPNISRILSWISRVMLRRDILDAFSVSTQI